MIVGLLSLELQLPGCDTLKEKRHRIKGVIEKVRGKFNVSVAEVDFQDMHQSAMIGVAMVNSEKVLIEQVFARVDEIFESGDGLIVVNNSVDWF
jgi:uncharacterized protein YlxP (DUF503 family)